MQAPSRSWPDRLVERRRIAGAALDRDLTHAVQDRRERPDLPQGRLRQRADLTPPPARDADRDGVPVAVVVADQQGRLARRQVLDADRLEPAPSVRMIGEQTDIAKR